MAAFTVALDGDLFNRFSTFTRLIRVIGYCLRFVHRARKDRSAEHAHENNSLTANELRASEKRIIRLVQETHFAEELRALKSRKAISTSSSLLSLNPFLDNRGLLRVGGRLENSALSHDAKHQLIMPGNSHITDILVQYEHRRLLHAGCQLTTASLREKYWILACRRNVRRVLNKCVRCFRVRPSGVEVLMGDLPAARVMPGRPFTTCGIDYAGPLLTKERVRSKTTLKSYICIFVCFATKAIHLEVATDLSTDAFLNCLRRFTSRRGLPHHYHVR